MAEITFRLSKREAEALAKPQPRHVLSRSQARSSAEFKMRQAIWSAFPELREQAEGEGSK